MKLGLEKAKSFENFESLWFVVSKALGGDDTTTDKPTKNLIEAELALGSKITVVDTNTDTKDPFKGLDGLF